MSRPIEDTYKTTLQTVAQILSTRAPRGLSPRYLPALQRMAAGEQEIYGEIDAVFERAGSEVRMSFKLDVTKEDITDLEGNEWYRYTVTCGVSWPTHGTVSTSTALARIGLMRDVAEFAAELEADFDRPVMRCVCTKAEREERTAKYAKQNAETKVAKLIEEHCKGMRVEQQRLFEGEHGLEPGTYKVTGFPMGREYVATVTAPQGFYYTRSA